VLSECLFVLCYYGFLFFRRHGRIDEIGKFKTLISHAKFAHNSITCDTIKTAVVPCSMNDSLTFMSLLNLLFFKVGVVFDLTLDFDSMGGIDAFQGKCNNGEYLIELFG
jgi:hypothetical protein